MSLEDIKKKEADFIILRDSFEEQKEEFIEECQEHFLLGMLSKDVLAKLAELELIDTPETNPMHGDNQFKDWVYTKLFKWEVPFDQAQLNFFKDELRSYILKEIFNESFNEDD